MYIYIICTRGERKSCLGHNSASLKRVSCVLFGAGVRHFLLRQLLRTTDKQTDRQADKPAERQAGRHAERQPDILNFTAPTECNS